MSCFTLVSHFSTHGCVFLAFAMSLQYMFNILRLYVNVMPFGLWTFYIRHAIHMLGSHVCWGTADSTMNCLCSYNAMYLLYRFRIGYIQFIYDLCKTFSYAQ